MESLKSDGSSHTNVDVNSVEGNDLVNSHLQVKAVEFQELECTHNMEYEVQALRDLTNMCTNTGIDSNAMSNEIDKDNITEKQTNEYASESLPNSDIEMDLETQSELTLDNLPTEIIIHICSFLHSKFVIKTFSKVCKAFQNIFNDNAFWKIRLGKRWHKKYPAIPVNDHEFNWIEACIAREEQHRIWSRHEENTVFYRYREGLFAPVDTVHFLEGGHFLAAGSRDRYLNVLDIRKLDPNDDSSVKQCRAFCKMEAHKGWIWSMSSLDSLLATGSWDHYVKFWDLAAGCTEIRKAKCKSPVLCTHFEPGYFMAGCYDHKVYHIDPRAAALQAVKDYHKRAILCMAADDKYVITGSEDKRIAVFDRRADKIHTKIVLPEFPLSMSYGRDQLWVGDKAGSLHLFDATDGDFNIVQTYDEVHTEKITGVIHTLGAMFTCSTDKTVKVLEPTLNPGVIGTLSNHTQEIAKLAFANGVVASASSDMSIGIWVPKDSHENEHADVDIPVTGQESLEEGS